MATFRDKLRPWKIGAIMCLNRAALKLPSQTIRKLLLVVQGARIGQGTVLYGGSEVWVPLKLEIGAGSSIGNDCILDARGGLKIGHGVNLSTGVWIWTSEHDVNSEDFAAISAPVTIEDHAWLGGRTIIMPGVVIGRGAVVASGAVVTKSVAEFEIVGGVPAKKIGVRKTEPKYALTACFPFI